MNRPSLHQDCWPLGCYGQKRPCLLCINPRHMTSYQNNIVWLSNHFSGRLSTEDPKKGATYLKILKKGAAPFRDVFFEKALKKGSLETLGIFISIYLYGYVLLFHNLFHFANPSGNQDGNGNSLKISASCHKSATFIARSLWGGSLSKGILEIKTRIQHIPCKRLLPSLHIIAIAVIHWAKIHYFGFRWPQKCSNPTCAPC